MDTDEEPDDQAAIMQLQQDIAERYEMQEAFHNKGWPRIVERLESAIAAVEALILSGKYEGNPTDSAFLRGQIQSYKTLVSLPALVSQEIEIAERELNERP